MNSYDVVIVGGGISGLSTASALYKRGLEVLVIEAGDEASLRAAMELEPNNAEAIMSLAELCAGEERADEALALLEKIPETPDTRRIAALARRGPEAALGVDDRLAELLDSVKVDDDARKEFVDLLELLPDEDPAKADWRRQLTARLF